MEPRMQRNLRSLMIPGLVALATGGVLVAQAQDVGSGGRPGGLVQEPQILVAHGLSMAIEASTLDALGTQQFGVMSGPRTPGAVGPDRGVSRPGASPGGGGAVGTGAGGAGGTVSRAPYGSDDNGRGTAGAANRTAGTTGIVADAAKSAGPGVEGSRTALDPAWVELQRHAMKAFDIGDRLIKQAPQGNKEGPGARFQAAALRYAATLRRLAEQNNRGEVQAETVVGELPVAPVGVPPGTGALSTPGVTAKTVVEAGVGDTTDIGRESAGDLSAKEIRPAKMRVDRVALSSIVILNHAVKEALDSMQLKQMVRLMGSSETPTGRALLAHASEMETASLTAVNNVLTAGKSGSRIGADPTTVVTSKPAEGPGEPLQQLAMQASDVVMAISALTADQARIEKPKGSDEIPDRSVPKPNAP